MSIIKLLLLSIFPALALASNFTADNFLARSSVQYFDDSDYVDKITMESPTLASSWSFVLPPNDGDADQFLQTNGSGTSVWSTALTPTTGWALLGNAGTTAGTNFLGTTDAQDVVIKRNSTEIARAASGGFIAPTVAGSTASGGDITVSSTTDATKGSVIIPDEILAYGALGNGATVGSLNLKAKSDTLGEHLQLEGPGTNGNRFLYVNQRENGDMFFYNPGLNRVLLDYNAAINSTSIGQSGGFYQFNIVAADSGTSLGTIAQGTGLSIMNTDATAGNFSVLGFQGTASGRSPDSAIYGVHDLHSGASSSGSLEFYTRNAGTLGRGMRIAPDKTVTVDSLTASQAVVTDGSKQLASLAYGTASSASSLVQRDANQNAFANNFTSKGTNVVSAGGTTTLTAASTRLQNLTGSSAQTFQLPDATTLTIGSVWEFDNNSSGLLSVTDGSGGALGSVISGGYARFKATAVSTTAGAWDWHYLIPKNSSWGTAGATIGTTGSSSGVLNLAGSTSGLVTIQPQAAAGTYNFNMPTSAGTAGQPLLSGGGGASAQTYGTLGVAAGGTGQTSYTDGQLLIGNSSGNTLSKATLTAGSGITITNGGGSISIAATGSSSNSDDNMIYVDSGNGFGSTNTTVRRYSQVRRKAGSLLTYADSATNGASFTVATGGAGAWMMCAHEQRAGAQADVGITVNGASLTTTIGSITYANGFRSRSYAGTNSESAESCTVEILADNDIVRVQGSGSENNTNSLSSFMMTRLGSATSQVTLMNGNGYGSTNTKIRNYTNENKAIGTDITGTRDATNGADLTVSSDGMYVVCRGDGGSAISDTGFSVNSAQLTTGIFSVTYAQGKRGYVNGNTTGRYIGQCWAGPLSNGDVFRAHDAGGTTDTTTASYITMVKVDDGVTTDYIHLSGAGGSGVGSVQTKKYYVTTKDAQTGTSASFDNSTVNGTTYTITEPGIYAGCISLYINGGAYNGSVVIGQNGLHTTNVSSPLMYLNGVRNIHLAGANTAGAQNCFSQYFDRGSTISFQGDGAAPTTTDNEMTFFTRIK